MVKVFVILYIVLISLILAVTTNAFTECKELGCENDFYGGMTYFNSQLSADDINIYQMNDEFSAYTIPKIYDMDNDGTKEIIINFNGTIKFYHISESSGWDIQNSMTVFSSSKTVSFYTVADLNDDNYGEVYVHGFDGGTNTAVLQKIEWNGSTYINETIAYHTGVSELIPMVENKAAYVGCDDTLQNVCLYSFTDQAGSIAVIGFNYSNVSFGGSGAVNSIPIYMCSPVVPYVEVVDYDYDGDPEFFFSYHHADGTDEYNVYGYSINQSKGLEPIQEFNANVVNDLPGPLNTADLCNGNELRSRFLTAPAVFDYVYSGSGSQPSLEVLIGYSSDFDNYKIDVFDNGGTHIQTLETGDGVILSNIIQAKAFDNNRRADACIFGFNPENGITESQLQIFCVSDDDGVEINFVVADVILGGYVFFDDMGINISNFAEGAGDDFRGDLQILSHVIEADGNLAQDEFLTPYGVINTRTSAYCLLQGWFALGSCPATLDYEISSNTADQGIVMPIDYDEIGYADLLHIRRGSIRYLDDGLSNSQSIIYDVCVNPGVQQVWLLNTSVVVKTQVIDYNGDIPNVNVTLYDGTIYNITNTPVLTEITYPDDITFRTGAVAYEGISTFIANASGNNLIVKVRVDDNESGEDIETFEFSFSVSSSGTTEYGDGEQCFNFASTIGDDDEDGSGGSTLGNACDDDNDCDIDQYCDLTISECADLPDADENNFITDALRGFSGKYQLPIILIMLILMVVVDFAIFSSGLSKEVVIPAIVVADILIIIAFSVMQLISPFIIITLMVLVVVIGAIVFSKGFSGSSGGG